MFILPNALIELFIFKKRHNYIVIFVKSLSEKIFVYSVNFLSDNIKLINPIQKYPHIIESYACILKIFAITFLLPINFIISLGIYSTSKLSK